MVKGFRRSGFTLVVVIILIFIMISGCSGKKTVSADHPKVTDQKRVQAVTTFHQTIRPLIEETNREYAELTQAMVRYGYSEIDQKALAQKVNQALMANQAAVKQVETLEVDGDLELVKGGLSTCLYLRGQEMQKLQALVQQEKPKTSELNKILEALRVSEGFLERATNKLEDLETQVGIPVPK